MELLPISKWASLAQKYQGTLKAQISIMDFSYVCCLSIKCEVNGKEICLLSLEASEV